jgi:hypothetical protein
VTVEFGDAKCRHPARVIGTGVGFARAGDESDIILASN